jgi:hypothetical protein
LRGRRTEEAARVLRNNILQGAIEPHGRVLEHVIGLLPALHAAKVGDHLACQAFEPVAGEAEQLIARRRIAAAQAIERPLHVQ